MKSPYPLIVVIENDIGKVLGNALNVMLERKKAVICIDGIHTPERRLYRYRRAGGRGPCSSRSDQDADI